MSEKALAGVKVVDFGWVLVSPLTVKLLGDYGATAICVESPKNPGINRMGTPFKDGKPGVDRAGHFAYCAPNKLSISVDFRNPHGMEICRRLVAWADVVSENRRTGVIKKMGLDYESLTKINPGIIMVSSSNQGQTGPFASHPGLGIHLLGLGGFNSCLGWPEQEAITLTVAYTDYLTPPLAVATIVAALDRRRQTGEGQYLDVSQLEAGLQFMATPLLERGANGREPEKRGNAAPCAAPHSIYRCQGEDRWCAIAVFTDGQWDRFCSTAGHPEWRNDPRFSTLAGRKAHEDELNRQVEAWTQGRTAEAVMAELQAAGVPAGVVQTSRDLYGDPQLAHRGFFWKMDHHEMGPFTHLGEAAILSETPATPELPGPCLGEHTEMICKEFLGMSDEEFVESMINGAFGF